METKSKPPCKFGMKCYRKNSKHFELYFHPKEFYEFRRKPESNLITENKESRSQKKKIKSSTKKRNFILEGNKTVKNGEQKITPVNISKNSDNSNNSFGTPKYITNDIESNQSTSWIFTKNESIEKKNSLHILDLKNKPAREIIKMLFLVDMPSDFYSFYEFCTSINKSENINLENFQLGELKLVGPFDILSGMMNHAIDLELFLCHWRFYYDPPEFQTVLATASGFHIGYWRDVPKENPVFLASNNPNKDCIFKIEAENIFGTVYQYLSEFIKSCDLFKKVKIMKLSTALSDWAKKKNFSLEKMSSKMRLRQKKIASKTFHRAGIVVPVDAKTEIGYRPLIETDANLKKICKLIMEANSENEKDSLWENLQPLITAANIANDECDFGNSLELGIDLFCMGSPLFHEIVEHLLTTAYLLLNRPEFEKITKAHLKFRRTAVPTCLLLTGEIKLVAYEPIRCPAILQMICHLNSRHKFHLFAYFVQRQGFGHVFPLSGNSTTGQSLR